MNLDENEAKRDHGIELQNVSIRIKQKNEEGGCCGKNRKKVKEETEKVKSVDMKLMKRYAAVLERLVEKGGSK